jgi:Divergent InlB B-repeat domain
MKNLALCSRLSAVCAFLAALMLVQCTEPPYLTSIQVLPNAAVASYVGQVIQYKAYGTYTRGGGHPNQMQDITDQVDWISNSAAVATISSTGSATTTGSGTTTITASLNGIVATVSLTNSSDLPANSLTAITVIPISQTVISVGEPTQFIAIGTYNTNPMTQDVTDHVTWYSSDVKVSTINSAGLALANGAGTTTVTAIGTSNTGATIAGTTSNLSVTAPPGNVVLPQLAVYQVGLGTGTVTSADGVINCTTVGGAACTGNYVLGTTVTLTAVPAPGATFGGWSVNCVPDNNPTCSVVMNNNEPVGAIFNAP